MCGEVDKIKLEKILFSADYFQIGVIFCLRTNNNISAKKSHDTAVGIIVHLFTEFR